MTESGQRSGHLNRRGCLVLTVVAALFVLLLISISQGWLGHVDADKNTEVPVTRNNLT
jgi:hypothetical protein